MIEAARRLDMDEVVFLRCPDGSLMPDLDLREKIVRMIRTPQTGRDHHARSVSPLCAPSRPPRRRSGHDRRRLPDRARSALFPRASAGGSRAAQDRRDLVLRAGAPGQVVDITGTFDRKIDALRAHVSRSATAKSWSPACGTAPKSWPRGSPSSSAKRSKSSRCGGDGRRLSRLDGGRGDAVAASPD